jgi:hypothetical protein
MVRVASIVVAMILATAAVSCATDRYYRDVDIPNPEASGAVLRLFGTPAEIAVIHEKVIPGVVATSRWTYYFLSSRGTVHPIHFYFVGGRWDRRDEILKRHYERFRLLNTDSVSDTELILRYKRSHPR